MSALDPFIARASEGFEQARRALFDARAALLKDESGRLSHHDSPEAWQFYRLQQAAELLSEARGQLERASANPRGLL